MTPKGLMKYITAYVGASLTVLPVAIAGAEVGRWFDYHMTWYHVYLPLWSAVVGLPSMGWSSQHVYRTLGHRPTPVLRIAGQRDIPVATGLADAARSMFGAPPKQPGLSVAEEIVIQCGPYVFTEAELMPVLTRGWQRQRRGDHALSREYWLDRAPFWGDRSKYDSFTDALEACEILVGRRNGASGKLIMPPLSALHELRHRPYQ